MNEEGFEVENGKLPPRAFSNVINNVKPRFDFRDWVNSPEWAIFNAGMKEGAEVLTYSADCIAASADTHVKAVTRLVAKREAFNNASK